MSITRINTFQAAEGKGEDLYHFLKSLAPYITSCDGCISCEVLRNNESSEHFVIIEKWVSVDAHKTSIAHYPKEEMQAAMPLFGAPPEGMYYHA